MYIRKTYARQFYDGDIEGQIKKFEENFSPENVSDIKIVKAGIVPHAGWVFSGETAFKVFKTIQLKNRVKTFVLLGAVHVWYVDRISIFPDGVWETPIGDVDVDAELAEALYLKTRSYTDFSHEAHNMEHSIEVQVPFIKYMFKGAKIVPIMVPPMKEAEKFGHDLFSVLKNYDEGEVVVIASSDLTHYGSVYGFSPAGPGEKGHEWMKKNDRSIIEKCLALKGEEILKEAKFKRNACGAGAITSAVIYARDAGCKKGVLLEYITSFDRVPDYFFDYAVGYAGIVF